MTKKRIIMKTLWYIAKKDLLQITRDRNGLILMLVVPLVLISIVGFAFGSFYGNGSSQIQIKVALLRYGSSASSKRQRL